MAAASVVFAAGADDFMFGAAAVAAELFAGIEGCTSALGTLFLAETSVALAGADVEFCAGSQPVFAGCDAGFASAGAGELGTIAAILSFSTSTYP